MPASPPPEIRLYTQAMNPYSEKVAAALALKGLRFERVVSEDPEDIRRWSPIARTLPVLEINGRRKADSIEIVEWLDRLYPDPPILAADPKTAAAQRRLAEWSDSSFAWYWNRWRAARFPQPGDEAPVDQSKLAGLISRIVGQLGRPFRQTPTTRAEARELEIIGEIHDRLTDLVGFLGERPYFHASEPSIADLSVYAMLRVLRDGSIPHCRTAIDERPTLAAFFQRMSDRIAEVEDSWKEAAPADSAAGVTSAD